MSELRDPTLSDPTLSDPRNVLGTWQLARVIDDRRLGETTEVEGVLDLAALGPSCLAWEESATWHRPDGDVNVRRGLRLVYVDDCWWVRFEDGTDFHAWSPEEEVVHVCSPDTYRGQVSGTAEAWTVVWDVTGPEKDYRMTTVLTPGEGVRRA